MNKKDLAVSQESVPAPVTQMPQISLIDRAMALAENKDIDLERLQTVVAMAERMQEREAERSFYEALAFAQERMATVTKDKWNKHTGSFYTSEGALLKAVREAITPFGLSFTMSAKWNNNMVSVVGVLSHRLGHTKTYESVPMPLDSAGSAGKANKTNIQAIGSSTTYARKELVESVFAISSVEADNDGNNVELVLSPTQLADLEALVTETGANKDAILKWQAVNTFAEIKASQYDHLCRHIRDWAAKGKSK